MGKITGGEISYVVVYNDPGEPVCDSNLVIKAESLPEAEKFGIDHWKESYDRLLPDGQQYKVAHLPGQQQGEYCIVPSTQVVPTETPSIPTVMPTVVSVTAAPTQTSTRMPDNSVPGQQSQGGEINWHLVAGGVELLGAVVVGALLFVATKRLNQAKEVLAQAAGENKDKQDAMRVTLRTNQKIQDKQRLMESTSKFLRDHLDAADIKLTTLSGHLRQKAVGIGELADLLGRPSTAWTAADRAGLKTKLLGLKIWLDQEATAVLDDAHKFRDVKGRFEE